MATHLDAHKFLSLLTPFKNASLVNQKGELLFSKDLDSFKTTTSRLVLFQIAKKYLAPQIGDIIISNDPENGGTQLNRLFFVTCLHTNLFVVWDAEFNEVSFKIPLMPLVEKHHKNQMIWSALIDAQPSKQKFNNFFESQINKISQIKVFKNFISTFSSESFQKSWFQITKALFEEHFETKSYGQYQTSIQYKEKTLKMSISADEKLDVKYFSLDLSGSSIADRWSCASHVVESGLIIEVSKFYQFEKCLSQPILDKVKLLLPPKSIVSKANPTGEYNFELQKLTRQVIRHCLNQLNSQTKKSEKKMSIYSTYSIQLNSAVIDYINFLSNSRIDFSYQGLFSKNVFRHVEHEYIAELIYVESEPTLMTIHGIQSVEDCEYRWIKLDDERVYHGQFKLTKGSKLSFHWKI